MAILWLHDYTNIWLQILTRIPQNRFNGTFRQSCWIYSRKIIDWPVFFCDHVHVLLCMVSYFVLLTLYWKLPFCVTSVLSISILSKDLLEKILFYSFRSFIQLVYERKISLFVFFYVIEIYGYEKSPFLMNKYVILFFYSLETSWYKQIK